MKKKLDIKISQKFVIKYGEIVMTSWSFLDLKYKILKLSKELIGIGAFYGLYITIAKTTTKIKSLSIKITKTMAITMTKAITRL